MEREDNWISTAPPVSPKPSIKSKRIYDKNMVQYKTQFGVEKLDALKADAKATGITVAELMRRIVDMYLYGQF